MGIRSAYETAATIMASPWIGRRRRRRRVSYHFVLPSHKDSRGGICIYT